jgi:hypothetical protein
MSQAREARMKKRLSLLFPFFLLVAGSPLAFATDADILGVVRDETGAVMPGATITARNVDTGLIRSTTSDGQGRYRLVALPAGPYEVTAELTGFQTVVRGGITLTIGMKASVNFDMKVAAVAETITVTGESPIVETASSEVGLTFTTKTIEDLPLNGRNPTDLLLLAPGVSRGRQRGGYAIAGSLERNNSYTVDGLDNNDDIVGGRRVDLQQDVVREFILISNQFSAEFGRGIGGAVNILTQSGTNDFKGRVNFFLRDDAIDAQPFLSKKAGVEKSPFSRKTYGGNFGGPIVRDKTHFFASFEEEREGVNLEWDLPQINYAAVGPYPAVQGGFRVQDRTTKNPKFFGKVTHQFNSAHALAVTFNFDKANEPLSGCQGTDLTCYDFTSQDVFFVASETWVISPRTLNEIRVGRTDIDYLFLVTEGQTYPFHDRPGIDYGQQSNMPQGRDERHLIVSNTLSHIFNWQGDHDLRFGGEVNIMRSASFFDSNFGGTFLFDTDRPFDPNDRFTYPIRYTVRTGDSTVDRDMNLYAFFVQDNWRIKPNFTLNLGLRYDIETLAPHLKNTNQEGLISLPGKTDTNYRTDKNNFAPRVGFAWDVTNNQKTVIRGGFGIFYDQVFLNMQGNVFRFGVVPRTTDTTIERPCYPDPNVVIPGVCGGASQAGVSRSPIISTGDEVSPSARNFSLGFTREITRDMAVSADVVYVRTHNWPVLLDLNPRCTLTGTLEGDCSGPIGSDLSRPDRRWLTLSSYSTVGDKWHKGLLLSLKKRFSARHQFQVSYTLAKTEDTAPDAFNAPQSFFHPEREKGLSIEDQRHRLVVSGSWQLPWGIQLGGIVTYNNGRPFDITMGTDWNGNGSSTADRPDSLPTPANIDQGTADTRPYNPQGPRLFGADGKLPRDLGVGPNFFTVDLRVSRFIRFGNRSVEVLGEFFNLTNRVNEHANFVSGNVRSTQYYLRRLARDEISATNTYDPFQAQIGFRFNF